MDKILEGLGKPLTKEDVELRVGSNSAKSFTLLLYKTARVDRRRLDEVCPRWSNRHYLDDNKNVCCIISIWDDELKQWISREDVGTESQTEKEKGSYSDSFKRAGFRWGIGTEELYNAPLIRINWNMKESEHQGKKKYSPIDFWPNNLEISAYEVKEGKPQIEIKYDGKVIFPSHPHKKTENPEKRPYTARDVIDILLFLNDQDADLASNHLHELTDRSKSSELTESDILTVMPKLTKLKQEKERE